MPDFTIDSTTTEIVTQSENGVTHEITMSATEDLETLLNTLLASTPTAGSTAEKLKNLMQLTVPSGKTITGKIILAFTLV